MNKEHTETLIRRYPNLYKNVGGDPRQTNMAFGFACGDGWFGILDELSAKLEKLGVVAAQVKEKFGTLRFYTEPMASEVADEAWELIDAAEEQSKVTCELCGAPGTLRGGWWLQTLCNQCDKE
jgi:hypothetical protein